MAKKDKDNNKELEVLFPERILHTSLGEITVFPFRFGDFAKIFAIIDKYKPLFINTNKQQEIVFQILANGKEGLDDIAQIVNCATGIDRDWLDKLPGDEVIDLLLKIVEVNSTFFLKKINQSSMVLAERIRSVGEISSPSSSEMDTRGQTFEDIQSIG